jgi:hypothetical protein
MTSAARRHRVRNLAATAAVILVGVTLPLTITKGNKIYGGNTTLVALWVAVGVAAIIWLFATDFVVDRSPIAWRGFRGHRNQAAPSTVEPSTPEPSRPKWESSASYAASDPPMISFELRSKVGAQMARGFACDVRGPLSGPSVRAVSHTTGPSTGASFQYPRQFSGGDLGLFDGEYKVVWSEPDEDWEWHEILRSSHNITLPPPPPSVQITIQMEYDNTVLISVGIYNPRREDITSVGLNFLVPDFVTELTPADQDSGRAPIPGSVRTTSEKLGDAAGNVYGSGSKYWDQTDIKLPGRFHTVMYFRATLAESLRPFPVKLVLASQDLEQPNVFTQMIRPQTQPSAV